MRWCVTVADLGFLEGGTLGTRQEQRGSELTGEFYAFGHN